MEFIKKHRKLIIFFMTLLVLSLLHSALLPVTAKADFGNFAGDTDYGGGGGSDGGGDSWGDVDFDDFFGIGAILLGVVIFIILLIAAFIYVIIDEIKEKHGKKKKKGKGKDNSDNTE